VAFFFKTDGYWKSIKDGLAGSAQGGFNATKLGALSIPIPPLSEQRRIVGILDEAFDGITTAKANAETNLQNARGLFEGHLRSVFTQRGAKPRASEWHSTKLAELAAVQSGSGFPIKHQGKVKGGIPFYKVSDMNLTGNEREMTYENNSITEDARRELGAFLFPAGSIIFPKIGGAIATNKKRLTTRDCCVDNNVMGVIPKGGKIDSEFLYHFFLGHDLSLFANEAHLPSIKKTIVEDWEMCVPKTLSEQRRLVAQLDAFTEETQHLESIYLQKLATLEALKKSLLHQAFTGQL
jgi:restriction endonuclease S subunit